MRTFYRPKRRMIFVNAIRAYDLIHGRKIALLQILSQVHNEHSANHHHRKYVQTECQFDIQDPRN